MWTDDLDDESWSCLVRWRAQNQLLDDVFTMATHSRYPSADRDRVVEFCRGQGLAPTDPVDRAVYFLRTRQPEQYEALDPDGTLLVAGYSRADHATRTELRAALTGTGSMGLIRIITQDAHAVPSATEVEDVARGLAADGHWARLWRLARELRLDQAVRAVRLLGDWRPADREGKDLADRLAAADPATIEAVVRGAYTKIATADPVPTAAYVSIAPDGTELAFFDRERVTVCSLDGGEVVSFDRADGSSWTMGPLPPVTAAARGLLNLPDDPPDDLAGVSIRLPGSGGANGVHLGDAVFYLENTGVIRRRRPDWQREVLPVRGERLTAVPGGYVVDGASLTFGDVTGYRSVPGSELGIHGGFSLTVQAAEPGTGRLAVTAGSDLGPLLVVGRDGAVLGKATTWAGRYRFFGPERLVAIGADGVVRSWRVADGRLDLEVSRFPEGPVWFSGPAESLTLVSRDDPSTSVRLDPVTLEPVAAPEEAEPPLATVPGGTHAVFRVPGGVALRDLRLGAAAEILGRPVSHLGITDLGVVTAAAERNAPDSGPGMALNLLLDFLHHRMGAEIGVGAVQELAADDDIQLGGA
jgi:hypothetical protein